MTQQKLILPCIKYIYHFNYVNDQYALLLRL